MNGMHSLLRRQLKRNLGDLVLLPEYLHEFIQAVNEAYQEFDADRGMLERSLELSSQELLEANSEMRAIFQAIPDLLFRIDSGGTILEYAAGSASVFSGDPRALVGRRIQDVHSGEVADQFLAAMDNVRKTGSITVIEYCLPIINGKQCFEARLMPLLQDQMIAIVRNITDKIEAEEKLKESERRLHCILHGSPIPALVISRDHRVIHWNRALEELTGIKGCEMIGTDRHWNAFYSKKRPCMADIIVDQDFDSISRWYDEYDKSRLLEEALEGTLRLRLRGPGQRIIHFTAAAIRDSRGELVGAIETFQDITEHKEAEQALAEAEEKYRSMFENAVNGIFQVSVWGHLIRVNRSFAEMLGYDSPEEVLEKLTNFGAQVFVKPERYLELLHLLEEKRVVREFEAQFFQKDERIVWITINARGVYDSTGKTSYIEGTALDITERKMFESRLFQRQKMDAIGTLAGGVAHDFNNLLSPIIGYTELALNNVPHETKLRSNLEQVLRSANRARDLVRQILAFSRPSEQEQKPVQLSLVMKEAMEIIRSSLPSTIRIEQKIDPEAGAGVVKADRTQMHQVIMNLCTNAGQAMSEKGGLIEVSLKNERVDPIATRLNKGLEPGTYLLLSIRDTGQGMDHATIKRIFDPYFTTKSAGKGTGLGLAVVYSIVKNHKGVITVYSEPGQGSNFHIYLPRIDVEPAAAGLADSSLQSGSGRILLVDDDEAIVELEKQMIEELGYEVTARCNSIEALETFKVLPDRFDLVFADQTMPNMTGLELAAEIHRIRPEIPVILCTGFSDHIVQHLGHSGVKTILSKPILMGQLAETLNKFLCKTAGDCLG